MRCVVVRCSLSPGVVSVEVRKLLLEHSRVKRVESPVESLDLVAVLNRRTEVSHLVKAIGDSVVLGHDHSAVSQSSQVLRRVEAERSRIAPSPDSSAIV